MVKGEKRRQQILDTAEALFYQRGYENTAVQDVLDAVGLSKGGFYHHFQSKEQLLDEICDAKARTASIHASQAALETVGDAAARLNAIFDRNGLWRQDNVAFLGLLINVSGTGRNMMMRERLKEKMTQRLLPLLQQIVREGCDTHLFYTQYPVRICGILLGIINGFTDELAQYLIACAAQPPDVGEILRLLEVYRSVVERLLEAPYGSITLYQIQTLSDTCQDVWHQYVRPGAIGIGG